MILTVDEVKTHLRIEDEVRIWALFARYAVRT